MTAGRIIFPGAMPIVDDAGDRIAGAKAYFYANGTVTPANVYSDSGLTAALSNPVVADSLGVWPDMWANTTTLYTVALADEDGIPLPGKTWSDLSSAIDATLASADLASGYADEATAAATSALGAPGTSATSTTSLAVGLGPKTLGIQTGKSITPGQRVVSASAANPLNQMSGIVTAYNSATGSLSFTADATAGSGTHADWNVALTGDGAVSAVAGLTGAIAGATLKAALSLDAVQNHAVAGKQAIWIPAGAMQPRTTNGAAAGLVETTTNKHMIRSLDFDASTKQYAQVALRMPKAWDLGTITAVFEWSHPATTTNFKVAWAIQGVAISDGDAIDAAFGTAVQTNDTGGTTDTTYVTPVTAAVTIAGAPAAEDLVIFQIYRVADDAVNDTLAVNARLRGVTLYITTTTGTDD